MTSRIGKAIESLNNDCCRFFDRIRDQRTAGVLYRYSEITWNGVRKTISWNSKYDVRPITNRSSVRVEVVRSIQKVLNRVAPSEGTPMV